MELVRHIKVMMEALELQVVDGVDLGGRAIDTEIQNRILKCDAFVALFTPWSNPMTGNIDLPSYVLDEYLIAMVHQKDSIRVVHEALTVQGMYQQQEFIPHKTDREVDTLLKLMRTMAFWKRRAGKPRQVEIAPADLGERVDRNAAPGACEYQLLLNFKKTDWKPAQIWYEPGAAFAYLPSVPEESKIRLRLNVDNERWESAFSNLFGRIELERR